jgi:acyl carrier protein
MPGKLIALLAEVVGFDPSEYERLLAAQLDLGWKPLRRLQTAAMLESEYAIALSDEEFERMVSVVTVREILAEHGVAEE